MTAQSRRIWIETLERTIALGAYFDDPIPLDLLSRWLPPVVPDADLVIAGEAISRAIGQRTDASINQGSQGGPAPVLLHEALLDIVSAATRLHSAFSILIKASERAGQTSSEYGGTAGAIAHDLSAALLTGMLPGDAERALHDNPVLKRMLLTARTTSNGLVMTEKFFLAGLSRLIERAKYYSKKPFPQPEHYKDTTERQFVCQLAKIWENATGRKASVSTRENYLSPFYRFMVAIYAHRAGSHIATLQFERDQTIIAEASFATDPSEGASRDRMVAAEKVCIISKCIETERKMRVPSTSSVRNWLKTPPG